MREIEEEATASDDDSSMYSDSDILSDEGTSDDNTSSSVDTTPAGSPLKPPIQRGVVPSLRFSLQALPREDDGDGAPPTLRRVSILDLPTNQIPVSACGQPPLPNTAAKPIAVDIISPAFSVVSQARNKDSPLHQCSSNLGIPIDSLKFYALLEIHKGQELPPQCDRMAVEVSNSQFSMTALEELLIENKKLTSDCSGHNEAMESLQKQLTALASENAALRRQLSLSEALRQRGQRALHELKSEFEILHKELTAADAMGVMGPFSSEGSGRLGTPAAVDEAELVPASV